MGFLCQNLDFTGEKDFASIVCRYQNAFDNFYHFKLLTGIAVINAGPCALARARYGFLDRAAKF